MLLANEYTNYSVLLVGLDLLCVRVGQTHYKRPSQEAYYLHYYNEKSAHLTATKRCALSDYFMVDSYTCIGILIVRRHSRTSTSVPIESPCMSSIVIIAV